MSKPDTSVAIASLLLSAVVALGACNHRKENPIPPDGSGTDSPGGDAPTLAADAVVSERPVDTAKPLDTEESVVPADAAADLAGDSQRDTAAPPDAQGGDASCAIAPPIAGADCDRCLTQHCCQQAQQCPFLATLQGAAFGPGCRNGLRCLRRCVDAGACRIDQAGPAAAVCSNGIGPQGGTALQNFLFCAAMKCPVVCAEGL